MEESPERYFQITLGLLPVVEQIDPALVPEIFWHHVASRLPYGDPRGNDDAVTAYLTEELAWYDREVAAALFAPTLARIGQTDVNVLATWRFQFLAWSAIDPRAAVARLEQTPISLDSNPVRTNNFARFAVGASLGRTRQEQLRNRRGLPEVISGGRPKF